MGAMREPLQDDWAEPEVRKEIAEETGDNAGSTDLRYRHWLAWGAFAGAIFVLVVMTVIISNAVETDWQEVTQDADGNRYLIDHLALRWSGEQTPYAVQIVFREPTLRYKGIPVSFVLEKGTLDCGAGFSPKRRMHLAADQDLLYLETVEKAPGLKRSLMPEEIREHILNLLCRRR